LGARHLLNVLAEYAKHDNGYRPHQPSYTVDITARIVRRQVLGGLISEYRKAAKPAKNCWSAVISKFRAAQVAWLDIGSTLRS